MADSTVPNPTAPMSKTNSTPRIACQRVPATERVIVAADASGLADESELDESTRRRCRRADQRHGQCGHDDHRLGDCPPSIPRARHRRPSPYPSNRRQHPAEHGDRHNHRRTSRMSVNATSQSRRISACHDKDPPSGWPTTTSPGGHVRPSRPHPTRRHDASQFDERGVSYRPSVNRRRMPRPTERS